MNPSDFLQLIVFFGLLFGMAVPLGIWMAKVYQGDRTFLSVILRPVENAFYRLAGVTSEAEMDWKTYAVAMLVFNGIGLIVVYALQRMQAFLPLDPQGWGAVTPDSAWNTAVSFATNTNWQGYGGETTMSYLTQMVGLTVQNFLSAATGMSVLIAFLRGFVRRTSQTIGNFWVDLTRSTLYVLLPLSLVVSLLLVSQGVVQTFAPYPQVSPLQAVNPDGAAAAPQIIAVGPAASQIAIKQLGTNGGGFFNANSSHPFENPTPLSNLIEMISILLIPAALVFTFGKMVGDMRQSWAIAAAMSILFVSLLGVALAAEQSANPNLARLGVDPQASDINPGGNMEGKETRLGVMNSVLWAAATTAASNGSVNSMHDSFTPIGGLVPLFLIQLGEIVYGGVGSGLYGMLAFVIVAVFVAGLMVGRTPEYLGKKIEAFEMKMASLMLLLPIFLTKVGAAVAVMIPAGTAAILNPGPHGFSEILYAFSSAANNNGSAFAGLSANSPFYNVALGVCMFFARFWLVIPALAIAGSLAGKKKIPVGAGTLPTHTPLFVAWLLGVIIIVGALSFLPALSLGPYVEHLMLGQ
jgi:potassium-transporting ATPase potassium-binding subunit